MIFKSYIIENNLENLINFKFILFYGENIGLKRHFKKTLIKQYADTDIISIYQEDLDKNKNLIGVATLSNPVLKKEDQDISFKIKLDIWF